MILRNRVAALTLAAVVLVAFIPAVLPDASGSPGRAAGSDHGSLSTSTDDLRPLTSGFAASTWQSYAPPAGFPGLFDAGVASDPVDHSLVVFGGCVQLGCHGGTNATWVESNGTWTELHPSLSPPSRSDAGMAWDPADGYVLLFGGTGCLDPPACIANGSLNDTWAFKDGNWNPVVPSGPSPPPTVEGGLAYDPSDRLMVQFGGFDCTSSCRTWAYSEGTWTELNLTVQPPMRYGEGFAEDDADHGAVLFGGVGPVVGYLNDTWLFSDGAWHSEPGAPSALVPRQNPAMAWDPNLGAVFLVGGDHTLLGPLAFYNDTWEFLNGTWTEWRGSVNPGEQSDVGMAEDPTTGLLVLVGGCGGSCPAPVLWEFGLPHAVSAMVETAMCANVTLAGSALIGAVPDALQNGTYPLHVSACPGFLFANLTASSSLVTNVTGENGSQWAGSLLVHGAGTLFVNLTRVASNPAPTGLAAISVLGLTFLELLLILIALAAVVGIFVAVKVGSRRRARPPPTASPPAGPPSPKSPEAGPERPS